MPKHYSNWKIKAAIREKKGVQQCFKFFGRLFFSRTKRYKARLALSSHMICIEYFNSLLLLLLLLFFNKLTRATQPKVNKPSIRSILDWFGYSILMKYYQIVPCNFAVYFWLLPSPNVFMLIYHRRDSLNQNVCCFIAVGPFVPWTEVSGNSGRRDRL